ncbi:hypothetical protein [Streptomyces sp. NPDC007905]|uniref:hypothetical protein n=1 Tax=Streptomyces sp. NPDC007905 TaxID=3364788 RepID=UPI0036E78057
MPHATDSDLARRNALRAAHRREPGHSRVCPGLEAQIQKSGKGREQDAVRTWLERNPGPADTWAPVAQPKSRAAG